MTALPSEFRSSEEVEVQLRSTGERYLPEMEGDIEMEHLHRYAIARDLAYGKDVLDIACGEGYGSELLATVARRVTGVDISEEAIAHAARKYVRPNIAFAVGSCACVPLPDASVDLVVSFETIEHHDQHLEMMAEIRRVLRPDGILIISSPDKHEYSDEPGYKNEYHVKELYLSEFRDLLATGFKHVRVFGQRVYFGSLVAPTDGRTTRFATYSKRDESVRREPGIMKPVYYIGLASNVALPTIHGGLYDGTSYLTAQNAGRDRQIASLMQAVAEHDRSVAERDGQIDALDRSVAERDGQINALNRSVAERDGQINALNRSAAERDRQINALNRSVAERDGQINALNRSVAQRDAQIAKLNRGLTKRDEKIVSLNRTVAAENAKLRAMRYSTSWRVTAPLRFVKSAARSLHARRRLRKAVSITATSLYRALPLSVGRKVKLKGWLFSALPFLFRHSAAYRNWLVSGGQQPAPAHVVSDKTLTTPLAHPASEMVHETCPPSVSKYLDDLFVRAQGNPGGSLIYVPLAADSLDAHRLDVKLIVFYLPQYHPIPENDQWWGKGFTEWTNVAKAMPQFVGHYQPRLPGELGFYDLRVPDVQRRQMELAKTYGIYGFCYHHYWFAGKRLLETPFNQVLASSELDLPFCLCWANENWTRRWDGLEQEVLMAQGYSEEDDLAFIRDIEPALRDRRYIRIDGRPLLIVYRVSQLPDARATANRWRRYCEQSGIGDLFLVVARSFDVTDPRPYGFDAAVQFPPHQTPVSKINNQMTIVNSAYTGNIFDYQQMARVYAEMEVDGYPMFRCVMPGWDNEARRPGKGDIFAHSSPEAYAEWLDQACIAATRASPSQRLVFVNAWNEWGEGAYLEPDRMYGYAYLHATTNVLRGYVRSGNAAELAAESRRAFQRNSDVAVVLHLYYEDLLAELSDSFLINVQTSDLFVTVRPDVSEATIRDLVKRFPNAYVAIAQNRGRDILPFLSMITLASTLGYEVGCKIHTKKSTHRSDGTSLRTRLVGELMGTRDKVERILTSFRADPKLGMVVPQGSRLPLVEECLNVLNRKWLNEMLPKLGRSEEIDLYRFYFPAGSMFWFRPAALNPLMQLSLQPDHFERELGQLDGTLAHTIERLFELSAEVAGYRVTDTRSIGACEAPNKVLGA